VNKKFKFQSPKGMYDILPHEQKYFRKIYEAVENIADFYAFGRIDTPIFEDAELFLASIGADTDIVQKEMYTLKTKEDDFLALRPEGTVSTARAYVENGMINRPQPVKLYYYGPFFRHEKPKNGHYRQFLQFGFEIFGEESSVADAQIIQIFHGLLLDLGLKDISIEINSVGDKECRSNYKRALTRYLKSNVSSLCGNCKKRIKENPLRVLDCKEERCEKIKLEAPQAIDYLCIECKTHFKKVLEYLDELELPYILNPYLNRGFDYYTRTVFEFFSKSESLDEETKKQSLGGGGRYDYLVKKIGGKDTPGVGGSFGIDRIVYLIKKEKIQPLKPKTKIFLAQLGDLAKRKSLKLAEDLRKSKISIDESFGRDSLKGQLARATKVGARYTVIIGQREAIDGTAIIRDMETGKQENVKIQNVPNEIKDLFKKNN
jgi:histidyl-tRNA synthetase